MPVLPKPLPPQLREQYFSRREACASGISASRLGCSDITRVRRGVYRQSHVTPSEFAALRVMLREREGTFLSHTTAARLYGVPLPGRLGAVHHITKQSGANGPRIDGVIGHLARVEPADVRNFNGALISAPERMMLELAGMVTQDELIAIGDSLVRIPRLQFDKRSQAWATVPAISAFAERNRGARGIRALRAAIAQVRVGADSYTETMCRLAIIRAGLPEPALQYALDPSNRFSFVTDLALPEHMIAIQYDGDHHYKAENQAHDSRRDAEFERAGWRVIRVNRADLAENFAFLIAELRRMIENG